MASIIRIPSPSPSPSPILTPSSSGQVLSLVEAPLLWIVVEMDAQSPE
ncbi:hypothetical protein KSS87_005640, partial [Heliosperma pusillum]